MKSLTRPPRAWCIAIRASDRRITPAHWIITPEHAMDLNHPEHPYEPIEHEVTIGTHAIRRYCHPVRIGGAGDDVEEVAKILGVTPASLWYARTQGFFEERFFPILAANAAALSPSSTKRPPRSRLRQFPPPASSHLGGTLGMAFNHGSRRLRANRDPQTLFRPPRKMVAPSRRSAQLLGFRWLCPPAKRSPHHLPIPPRPRHL